MSYQTITLEFNRQIAYITLNRPDVYNALNNLCVQEIKLALDECRKKQDVLCVVFTGKGDKAFAAGADIEELSGMNSIDMIGPDGMQEVFTYLYHFEKPTIAKVKGFALGGGAELALACDIRMAADNAKFGFPELNLAIIPGAGGTQRLVRMIGEGPAMHLILTGEMITAQRAYELGLVTGIYSLEEIDNKVDELASTIVQKGPLAAQLAKLSVKQGASSASSGLLIEKLSQAVLFQTKDKAEGMAAFLEKRKATFEGQ